MRYKFILLVVFCLVFALVSCEALRDDTLSDGGDTRQSGVITMEDARNELEKLLKDIDEQSYGTSNFSGKIVASAFTLEEGNILTRAADSDSSLIYVFNFEDNGGFALMSGRRELPSLLALSYSGEFTQDSADENPGLGIFLSELYPVIGDVAIGDYGDIVLTTYTEYDDWKTTIYKENGYCGVTWGQRTPYNDCCPEINGKHALTGCVATAVAQLMSIYKYPDSYDGFNFDWDAMTDAPSAYNVTSSAQNQIAELMYFLGLGSNLNVSYSLDGSSAHSSDIPGTLRNFGYSKGGSYKSYDLDTIISELEDGYSVLISGTAYKNTSSSGKVSYSGGHEWLCHGLMKRSREVRTYNSNDVLLSRKTETEWYLLCNWGWNGSCDGYYLSGAFNTNDGPSFPTNETTSVMTKGTSGDFQYHIKMITGIRK